MPTVDLAILAQQTGGDAALEREVLALFASRVPADVARLRSAANAEQREIAHLIVGSARAIGAGEVAEEARAIEAGAGSVDRLGAAVADAVRFISHHLARNPV